MPIFSNSGGGGGGVSGWKMSPSFILFYFTLPLYMVDSPKVGQLLILSQFLGKMKNIARS